MEFKELIAGFAAKFGIEGLDGADGVAELDVEGIRVELLDDPHTQSIFACAEIGHPPPDANGAFGAMMRQANFLLRGTYALVRPFPQALTDVESFVAGLESLVNQVENWRKALAGLREVESVQSTAPETDDSHHDMLSSGYFHV